ncbi:MAG: hypothetical protein L7V30_02840 [Gammaproteobacteria bacterium]|nr:hypothetical protein [Gammaproteobacteria bacterium]
MIYIIEKFTLDLDIATKAKLYYKEKLMFMGDGYKAINILIRNVSDKEAAKKVFFKQLSQRERPRFKDQE